MTDIEMRGYYGRIEQARRNRRFWAKAMRPWPERRLPTHTRYCTSRMVRFWAAMGARTL